jgi:hypothetical protein
MGPKKSVPKKCTKLDNKKCLEAEELRKNLKSALQDLENGFSLVMVYYDKIDSVNYLCLCSTNVLRDMLIVLNVLSDWSPKGSRFL